MSDFIAYQYDENGFYLGEVECQRDPKRNKPLLPRNCTFVKPPKESGYKWENNGWIEYKEDTQDWRQNILNKSIKRLSDSPTNFEIKEIIRDLMELL
jgi:hypothetical protein